jgi:hypothetical protein
MRRRRTYDVTTLSEEGKYHVGDGLYFQIKGNSKSWLFRYKIAGRGRWMGLGSYPLVSLTDARTAALEARLLRFKKFDPIEQRKDEHRKQQKEAKKAVTLDQCAQEWIERNKGAWKPNTYRNKTISYYKYIKPKLGAVPIRSIDADMCEKFLNSIWERIPSSGKIASENLNQILDFAEVQEYRDLKSNPMSMVWGRLKPFSAIHKVKHHEALPWQLAGIFIRQIRNFRYAHGSKYPAVLTLLKEAGGTMTHKQIASATNNDLHNSMNLVNDMVAQGLLTRVEPGVFQLGRDDIPNPWGHRPLLTYLIDFLLLTAVRSEMVTLLPWSEIYHIPDRNRVLWICPPERHKTGGAPHIVPLSRQAIAILDTMRERQHAANKTYDYVFVYTAATRPPNGSAKIGKPIYKTSLIQHIQRTQSGWPTITAHGFRTTFGDWSVENDYPERDSEMALGHAVEPQAISRNLRSIYKRNAHRIEQRLIMMQAWADFLDQADEALPAQLIPFNQARRNV